MTNMRRLTVSFPDDIERRLAKLKSADGNTKKSYAEIIRRLVLTGLDASDREQREDAQSDG